MLESKYVKNIYNLASDNLLVLDDKNVILYNYKNKKKQILKNENCPIEDFYSIISIDNELIVTGDNGACTVDINNMSYTKNTLYPSLKISHIYKPTDSIAWIGTKGEGLLKKNLKTNQLDTFNIEDGLLNLNVHSAFIDSHQRLWASTDYGLSVLDVNTDDMITLTSDEGIHENEMNIHSFLALPDSSLLYGTVNGVIHFSPNDIDLSFAREELNIESLIYTNSRTQKEASINYKMLPDAITIEPYYEDSRIKISSRYKNKPNNIRYLLSNNNSKNWHSLKAEYLDLSQLKDSKSTLLLSYRVGLNEWSSPIIVEIFKSKPFYMRSIFYFSCLASLIFLMLFRALFLQRMTARRNIKIQQKVDSQTIELSKKILALSKSNELNEKLFSIIGHDLKSPLSSLLNLNKSINHLIQNKDYHYLEKLGTTIESNARNSLEVVNRLLDWASSMKDTTIVRSNLEVESIFDIVVNDLQEHIQTKRINIKYQIDEKFLFSEKESLTIIIRNLIQNAIKYSETSGNIILTSYCSNKNTQAISVIDFGIGVTDKLLGKLELRTEISSRKGTNNEKGLGLGLGICLELSNRIGGQIIVSKNTPNGSIFTLFIEPISPKPV